MTRRWAPLTRYMLRRNTASMMKDFDLKAFISQNQTCNNLRMEVRRKIKFGEVSL